MQSSTIQYSDSIGWEPKDPGMLSLNPDLIIVFSSNELLDNESVISDIANAFPNSVIIGCSTAGEIYNNSVQTNSLVATFVKFDESEIVHQNIHMETMEDSFEAGQALAEKFTFNDLQHLLVLSEGLSVNGTKLVNGLESNLPEEINLSGGLAGDADRFENTRIIIEGNIEENAVGAIGFYGSSISIGYGTFGGWDPFGPERLVTHSEGNVLYTLDDKPALELYKKYLGEHAENLPASGLLFPLSVRDPESDNTDPLVRTILSIDEDENSMTFAGDIPEGQYARLMKANFDRLVEGARRSATNSFETLEGSEPELAILISCVGRRLILKQRTEDEIEAVRDVLGENITLCGFYSYGEISPFSHDVDEFCELHNQTMTITTLSEE